MTTDEKKIPIALDFEESVLGAILLESTAIVRVSDVLHADMFYGSANRMAYEAAVELSTEGSPIDIMTVKDRMAKNKTLDMAGGVFFLTGLTSRVASSANIEYHAKVIIEKWVGRQMLRISEEIRQQSMDPSVDVFELADKVGMDLIKLDSTNFLNRSMNVFDSLNRAILKLRQRREAAETGNFTGYGIPTTWDATRRRIVVYEPQDFVILAARPGMGKTSVALQECMTAAENGIPVKFFCLDMSEAQVATRIAIMRSSVDGELVKAGTISDQDFERMEAERDKMKGLPFEIDDRPACSIANLRARVREFLLRHPDAPTAMIVIDYLQLMVGQNGFRPGSDTAELTYITAQLKNLAKELSIVVMAVSQLNRDVEKRPDKRPRMSDLRQSGTIEQDADVIMFVFRAGYYAEQEGKELTDESGDAIDPRNTEIIFSKVRTGKPSPAYIKWVGKHVRFEDYGDDRDLMDVNTTLITTVDNYDEDVPF
jgi:replicative DNA helicase